MKRKRKINQIYGDSFFFFFSKGGINNGKQIKKILEKRYTNLRIRKQNKNSSHAFTFNT